jgi:radical SAM superfamily enzyme YgiQ (UPF0313 family)
MANKRKIDLVLVNPGNPLQVYQSLGSTLSAIEPPVWAGMIAGFIRNLGFSVRIIDANADNLSPEETAEQIADMAPVLTAVVVYGHQPSASTQNMPAATAICTAVKETDTTQKILLVGGHVAALPERTLVEEDVDFVCEGEGFYTIVELIEVLKANQADYDKVRGLLYWEDDKIRRTPSAPLVNDLDREVQEVAWDLLPMGKYRAHNWHCFGDIQRQPYAALYTTLGCPFHCSFCCIQAPFKSGERVLGYKESVNSYRFWSPHVVINQIDKLVNEYGVRNVKIADELFVLNAKHVLGICNLIIERGYNLNIWAYARVDTVNEKIMDKLKRAGVNWLAFGIEAASERVRKNVKKGFHQDKAYKAIEIAKAKGVNVIGNFIFGLPEDDMQAMKETLGMAIDLNCEFANFYCTMAYPGSKLYEWAIAESLPLPQNWAGYSQHAYDSLPLPTKHLGSTEVLKFRDQAFNKYFTNSRYIEMIRQIFGQKVVEHIKDMTSHKVARKSG